MILSAAHSVKLNTGLCARTGNLPEKETSSVDPLGPISGSSGQIGLFSASFLNWHDRCVSDRAGLSAGSLECVTLSAGSR